VCPENSNSPTGSDQESDCVCNAGFYEEVVGSCNACEAGKYKVATGNKGCTDCVVGKYSDTIGATQNVCASCPENSMSSEGSGDKNGCICNPGYTGEAGSFCAACDIGKFKNF